MNTAVLGEPIAPESDPDAKALESAEYEVPRPPEELALGTCIHGKYVIHGVLGHGGFAVVYDAEHLGLARRVAIKVLHLRVDTPLALLERFHCEARISALVRHPNVLEVYDTGTLPDGSPFLVMERVEGETLTMAINRGPLPLAMVVEVGIQLARGLDAIAEAGIVHRDIKPDNVMLHMPLDGAPRVKLVDFGISKRVAIEGAARLTCHGALVGTPQYMSPEQIRGEDVDVRSDLYALGAVLYEALTGRAPHESTNFSELVVAVLNSQIVPPHELRPNCPPAIEEALLKALARSRERRFRAPAELLEALERAAEQLGLPRGEEAFYAPDPQELCSRPRQVGARDTATLVRRLWPLRTVVGRPAQLAAAALLILGAQGAYRHFDRPHPQGSLATATQASTVGEANAPVLSGEASEGASALGTQPVVTASLDEGERSAALSQAAASRARQDVAANAPASLSARPAAERKPSAAAGSSAARPSTPTPERKALARAPASEGAAAASATLAAGASKDGADEKSKVASAPSSRAQLESSAEAQISKRRDWERTMQAALAELVRGQLAAAQGRYREAVRLLPREAAGFRGLGLVSARLGDVRTAREALQRYLELAPDAADAATVRGRLASLR